MTEQSIDLIDRTRGVFESLGAGDYEVVRAQMTFVNGAIVQTTLRHEAGEWIGRVSYNGSGKITGLLIAPPGSRDLPF